MLVFIGFLEQKKRSELVNSFSQTNKIFILTGLKPLIRSLLIRPSHYHSK